MKKERLIRADLESPMNQGPSGPEKKKKERPGRRSSSKKMGYIFRVRLASFFAGAAVASIAGIYALNQDYRTAHEILTNQADKLYQSLEGRISSLEKLQKEEAPKAVDTAP